MTGSSSCAGRLRTRSAGSSRSPASAARRWKGCRRNPTLGRRHGTFSMPCAGARPSRARLPMRFWRPSSSSVPCNRQGPMAPGSAWGRPPTKPPDRKRARSPSPHQSRYAAASTRGWPEKVKGPPRGPHELELALIARAPGLSDAARQHALAVADDLVRFQLRDVAGAHLEPAGHHLVGMLPELRRRLQFGRLTVEADRPGLALPVAIRVLHRLHDAALDKALVVPQLKGVVYGPGRHTCRADDLHRLLLGVGLGPLGNDFVDEAFVGVAVFVGREARVADQLLAADHLEQAVPMLGIGAAAEDVDVVVIAARLGRVDAARCGCAGRALRAHARRTLLVAVLGHDGKRGADVVHDRVLHRELQAAALAGLFFLVQRAENADAHQHAGAGVADRTARLDGRLTRFAGDAHRAAGCLRNHVESEVLLVGAAFAKAFDLAIDKSGVDCF